MNLYTNVLNNLQELKLLKMKQVLESYLDNIKDKAITQLQILKDLTELWI